MASRTDRFMLAEHDFRSRTSPRRPARTARRGSAALRAALSTHGSFLSHYDKEYRPLPPRHERDCRVSGPVHSRRIRTGSADDNHDPAGRGTRAPNLADGARAEHTGARCGAGSRTDPRHAAAGAKAGDPRAAGERAGGNRARTEGGRARRSCRSEEHTSELQSLMRISYAVFCLKKKKILHVPQDRKHKPLNTRHTRAELITHLTSTQT